MAEQAPLGGGIPWAILLENASPWSVAVLLAYLLWDTIKRQAKTAEKSTDLLSSLSTILQTRLGALTHELAEVRRMQSNFASSFSNLDESVSRLGKTVTQEVHSALLERAVFRASVSPPTLPDKNDQRR